ncbi:baseplate hub protein [Franconibacter daqui]|uniref:baseplate hub protein n=1 Tax=Franconibacter daqui TaxID=2047724 RepID=UPI002DBEA70A|nr:hypothetical protein [Franconibacter daqui]MEB5921432.1 hypothetical protein [Franconibacter daqui]
MFDDREVRIGIEVNGEMQFYHGAACNVKITKSTDSTQNSCDLTLDNLLPHTVDYLVTESSPWIPDRNPKLVTIMAGRQSTGVENIFNGDIVSAIPGGPPERSLTIKALTQNGAKYKWTSQSAPKTILLSELSKRVAEACSLRLRFEAAEKTIVNYLYNGPVTQQIKKLEQVGDVDCFIDDDELVVKDFGKGMRGEVRVISTQSGMTGIPTFDEKGVKVTLLFDPTIRLGQQITIQSEVNKAVNGQYVIYQWEANLSTHSTDWQLTLSCNNDNLKSIAEKREAQKKKDAKSNTKP